MPSRPVLLAAALVLAAAAAPAVLAGGGAVYEDWSHQLHDCQDDWGSDSSGTPEASGHDLVSLDLREGIIPGSNGTGFGIRLTVEGGYASEPADPETLADVVNLSILDEDGAEAADVVLATRDNREFVARSHAPADHVSDRNETRGDGFHVTAWYNHHRFGVDDGDTVLANAVTGYHIGEEGQVHERDHMPGGYTDPGSGEKVEGCPTPADTQRYRNEEGYQVHQTPGPPPVADFSIDRDDPEAGETINFTDRSTDPNDTVERWSWNFGDGTNATGPDPSHTYEEAGSYDVTLIVADAEGNRNLTQRTLEVEPAGPVAAANVQPRHPHAGETVYLNATSGDADDNLTFDWDLGDGRTATGRNVTHVYAEQGSYEVTLNVTDSQGRSDEASGNITIGPRQDTDDQTGGTTGDGNSTGGTGDENATGGPDDGTSSDGSNGDESADDGENRLPVARIDAPDQVPVGEPVTFTSRSEDPDGSIVAREWAFGDGASHGNATAEHAYREAGAYTVTLTVVDDDGDRDQAVHRVTVGEPGHGNETGSEVGANDTEPADPTQPGNRSTVAEKADDGIDPDAVPGVSVVGVVAAGVLVGVVRRRR